MAQFYIQMYRQLRLMASLNIVASIYLPSESHRKTNHSPIPLLSSVLQGKTTLELKGDQDPIFKDSEAESDCLSDRAAALEEQRVNI